MRFLAAFLFRLAAMRFSFFRRACCSGSNFRGLSPASSSARGHGPSYALTAHTSSGEKSPRQGKRCCSCKTSSCCFFCSSAMHCARSMADPPKIKYASTCTGRSAAVSTGRRSPCGARKRLHFSIPKVFRQYRQPQARQVFRLKAKNLSRKWRLRRICTELPPYPASAGTEPVFKYCIPKVCFRQRRRSKTRRIPFSADAKHKPAYASSVSHLSVAISVGFRKCRIERH